VIENRHFLIDCGEGAQMQLSRFQVPVQRIDHILISHLHGDHYLGLMGLLFSMHLLRRTKPLDLYAPHALGPIVTAQLHAAGTALCFPLTFHPLPVGPSQVILETDHIAIETIPLLHRTPTYGFLFREKPKPWRLNKAKLPPDLSWDDRNRLKEGKDLFSDTGQLRYTNRDLTLAPKKSRSYAYCSDTAYNEQLMSRLQGVDLIYHEATFLDEKELQASKTFHSTARQAALIARGAGASRLLLGHFSARYKDLQPLLDEARAVFPATDLAIEGESFTLEE
jgi:ribonuclease Z